MDDSSFNESIWREFAEVKTSDKIAVPVKFENCDLPAVICIDSKSHYISFFPSVEFLRSYLNAKIGIHWPLANLSDPENKHNPTAVRIAQVEGINFLFNYGVSSVDLSSLNLCPSGSSVEMILGETLSLVEGVSVLAWKCSIASPLS
jgi:hypothetical protein